MTTVWPWTRLLPCPDFVRKRGGLNVLGKGRLYVDGGGFGIDAPKLGRCTWSVVQLDLSGKRCKTMSGTLPVVQSVARAKRCYG